MTEESNGGVGGHGGTSGERTGTWDQVAARFSELGATIRQRYAAARTARAEDQRDGGTGAPDPPPGATPGVTPGATAESPTADSTTAGSAADEARSERATDQVMERLDDVFTSIGDTLRDPSLRREASTAFDALAEAVGSSLSDLGQQIQRRTGRGGTVDAPGPEAPGSGGGVAGTPPPPPPGRSGGDAPSGGTGDTGHPPPA